LKESGALAEAPALASNGAERPFESLRPTPNE
jgi:hypothetical protein